MSQTKAIRKLIKKVNRIEKELNGRLIERHEEVHGTIVCLLAEQHGLFIGPPGTGKCYGKNTPILMFDGRVKSVQDIVVGERLMGDDSTSRKVLNTTVGTGLLYKIIPVKGESFVVNEDHILSLVKSGRQVRSHGKVVGYRDYDRIFNIPVKDFLSMPDQIRYKLYRKGVQFPSKSIAIDPYILGIWLGGGCKYNASITSFDKEVVDEIYRYADFLGLQITATKEKGRYAITTGYTGNPIHKFSFQKLLREYGLIMNKHIPDKYKYNSRPIRLELLAGLIDADGSKEEKSEILSYTCSNEKLMDDAIYLCRSLGFAVYKKSRNTRCNGKDFPSFRISISGDCSVIPIKIPRKKCKKRKQIKNPFFTGFKIEEVGLGDYYGFSLDGNHLHLLGDFTVSHNSLQTELICERITGIEYFERLLTKFSTPEELFGPVSLPKLKEGKHERILKNMMPVAHVARIDEIWKGNSSILNSLLSLINERVFYNGTKGVFASPLISIFGTSNEMPESDELSALYDRFSLRYMVDYVGEDSSFKRLLQLNGAGSSKITKLKFDELCVLHEYRMGEVNIGSDILDMVLQLRGQLKRDGITVSDRRWRTALDILKVEAMLQERNDVHQDDLEILAHMLWNQPSEKKQVMSAVMQISNPALMRAIEVKDVCADVYSKAMSAPDDEKDGYGIEANKKLGTGIKELEGLVTVHQSKRLGEIISQLRRWKSEVLHHCLGISPMEDEDDDEEIDDEAEVLV